MALVVLLRGVNVGGHHRFRPSHLARQLAHLDAVNIGAAGTLVVRRPVTRARLREEVARRLPFEVEILVCEGREILGLLERHPVGEPPARPGEVRFVSVLPARPRPAPKLPLSLPARGRWLVRLVAIEGRFVLGVYRRDMGTIRQLGELDRLLGARATTRNANTLAAIGRVLQAGTEPRGNARLLRRVPSPARSRPMASAKDPTDAIRRQALTFPGVDKGAACNQSAFKAGKGTFLFIGPGAKGVGFKAMFKLQASLPQARELAAQRPGRFEVGRTGWVTARFTADEPLPKALWSQWLAESYALTCGAGPARRGAR